MPLPINYNRRCYGHDYKGRWIYLITMLKSESLPAFSTISRDPRFRKLVPLVEPSRLGRIIYEELARWEDENKELQILRSIVMPDHIHFEVFVRERLEMALGSLIAVLKTRCSQRLWEVDPVTAAGRVAMFEKGFNDKIAFRKGAKDAFYNYVADNPRRYLMKKLYPEYFYHRVMLEIDGEGYGLYGNLCLLDEPVKSCVKIKRDKSKMPDLEEKIEEWEETIRCGGILVSPFINPAEKIYRDKAIAAGTGLIIVVNYRFSDRQKPYRELFELCGEGRLLIVSTEQYERAPKDMRYSEAQEMNELARRIAELGPEQARLKPRR